MSSKNSSRGRHNLQEIWAKSVCWLNSFNIFFESEPYWTVANVDITSPKKWPVLEQNTGFPRGRVPAFPGVQECQKGNSPKSPEP